MLSVPWFRLRPDSVPAFEQQHTEQMLPKLLATQPLLQLNGPPLVRPEGRRGFLLVSSQQARRMAVLQTELLLGVSSRMKCQSPAWEQKHNQSKCLAIFAEIMQECPKLRRGL